VHIERPDVDDADAIADLWVALATGQRAHGSHLLAEGNRKRARQDILRHVVTGGVHVAVVNGEIIGFVTFALDPRNYDTDVTRGTVENVYVRPDHRDGGIGAALLSAAEDDLREAEADVVALEAMADNDDARRFYRRAGYRSHRVVLEKRIENDSTDEG